ncbi:hypothetical protein WR25_19816 isoform A [Diploscapter pachys]|uniref:SH2 domain-containing protein n=3 Tax=Diploscapter pachys TaxID=2018661 RepID=A0A2A2LAJ0_9BILA|nr:hypothetical protein WR25_19816 isoform A [Diploscapter pachys]
MALSSKRRLSDALMNGLNTVRALIRSQKDYTKRSFSTGDLADTQEQSDHMMIDFDMKGPSSSQSLPAHFDDCDRVPMRFGKNGPQLLNQQMVSSRKLMKYGSKEDLSHVSPSELHMAQTWFYPELETRKAYRILQSAGMEEGQFVVRHQQGRYILTYVHNCQIYDVIISCIVKDGQTTYRIGIDKGFKNLCDLVNYYSKHQLHNSKLTSGVSRPLRICDAQQQQPIRSRA